MQRKAPKRVGLVSSWVDNHSRKICRKKPAGREKKSGQQRKLHLSDHEVLG